jgi:hypothetical protein
MVPPDSVTGPGADPDGSVGCFYGAIGSSMAETLFPSIVDELFAVVEQKAGAAGDPETILRVDHQVSDPIGMATVGGSEPFEFAEMKAYEPTAIHADPNAPILALHDGTDGGAIIWIFIERECFERGAVKPHCTFFGAEPKKTVSGPLDRLDIVLRQTMFGRPDTVLILAQGSPGFQRD